MWEPGESARLPARPVVVMLRFTPAAEEALTARLHVELPSPQARRELPGAPRRWQLGPSVQLRVPQLELRLTGSRQKAGNCSYAPSSIMNICQHDLYLAFETTPIPVHHAPKAVEAQGARPAVAC